MRLTLRTLLAWLDDTLSPAEVRQIGKQVAESPFAKELVDRIHRVTRQRRLTVPSQSGPDATDANLVASYLDNELPAEQVAEFEKRCLTSDVHLAEVASVHQILSLIGQKAKVPTEARHRMYHLIKGREAVAVAAPRASQATEPAPVSEPIQPWVTAVPPRRPWIERFGPAAAVLALIAVLCWSAYQSLTPSETGSIAPSALALNTGVNPPAPKPAAGPVAAPAKAAVPAPEAAKAAAEMPAEADTITPAPAPEEPAREVKPPPPDVPLGGIGLIEKPAGLLLRYDRDAREWAQVREEKTLRDQDRLLGLDHYRATIAHGKARIDLVGETEIWAQAAVPPQAGRLNLISGRVVLRGGEPPAPFSIQFAGKTIEITPPAGVPVGLERINRRDVGSTTAASPVLRIFAPEGEVALAAGAAKETLTGPGAVTYELGNTFTGQDARPVPSWVTETRPTPLDLSIGEQFLKLIKPGRPLITEIVAATEDEQKDIRRLAISALKAVGDISYVVPLLSKPDDPTTRRAAIAVLRSYMSQGPDAERELHTQLLNTYGATQAATVEQLLVGFGPKDAKEESTFAGLVQDLSSPEVGIRELALGNLQMLTGRDELGYDPDNPETKGKRAWSDLLRNHELKAIPARKAEK